MKFILIFIGISNVLFSVSLGLENQTSIEEPADEETTTATTSTSAPETTPKTEGVTLRNPGLDARQEIANYNQFMDEIFTRMNDAIKAKNLDPMDLKLLPNAKTPRIARMMQGLATTLFRRGRASDMDVRKVRGWLHGMSTLKRSGDVTIFIHEDHRTIQCPFSLGPLELKVAKTVGTGSDKRTKSARATTDLMQGLMDMRIDRTSGKAEITNVNFDKTGNVDIYGNLKRTAEQKRPPWPYRLVLASKAERSLRKIARYVVQTTARESS